MTAKIVGIKNTNTIRIALVDIAKIYNEGLKVVLKRSPKIKIVGEAKAEQCLLKLVTRKKPQILLIDVILLNTNRIKSIADVRVLHPQVKIIILSNNAANSFVSEFMEAGVHGFIARDYDEDIIDIIKSVHSGLSYFSEYLLSRIEHSLMNKIIKDREEYAPAFSKTEAVIIGYICNGMTNKKIAEKLLLSPRTVEGYRAKILQKIKAKGTAGIVTHAVQAGIYSKGLTKP